MNVWDWIIAALVAGGIVLAALHMRKNRKSGKCPGGCDCCCSPCAKKEQKA